MFGNLLSSFDGGLFDEFRRVEHEMDRLFGRRDWPAGIRAVRRGTFPPVNTIRADDKTELSFGWPPRRSG